MKAGVKQENFKRRDRQLYRVVDVDDPEQPPILNREGEPIDGGGHRIEGISAMLAEEVNEEIERRRSRV